MRVSQSRLVLEAVSVGTMTPMATVEHTESTSSIVSLTPAAAAKISELLAGEEEMSPSSASRLKGEAVAVSSTASASTAAPRKATTSSSVEGVTVVVDPFSAPYLMGARVDYLETIQESGFKIDNPNATASCGCGHSSRSPRATRRDARRLRFRLLALTASARPG